MVIAGAGGHGLELLAIVQSLDSITSPLTFFDENPDIKSPINQISLISSLGEASKIFQNNPEFILGVGNPIFRERLDYLLTHLGGNLSQVKAPTSVIQSKLNLTDVMSFAFIGPNVQFGRGCLINTRANVHHECQIGDYSEIGPGALILGNVKIGKKCRIGAGAILLPGIEIGDEVIVGAGAVVTKSFLNRTILRGVPANDYG